MKAVSKQNPIPLELTLEFETLEELQAFEMIFHVSAIVEADFLHKHLNTDVISDALPGSYSDEQLDEFIADIERHFV